MGQLRLSKYLRQCTCVCTHEHLDFKTSTTNMEKKKFLHQSVIPVATTSWYTNIQATCFTFSIVLYKRGCTRACRMRTHYLERDWAWPKIVLRTCSTHGGYKLVALSISYYSYFFFWSLFSEKNPWNPVLRFSQDNFCLKTVTHHCHQYIHNLGTKNKTPWPCVVDLRLKMTLNRLQKKK